MPIGRANEGELETGGFHRFSLRTRPFLGTTLAILSRPHAPNPATIAERTLHHLLTVDGLLHLKLVVSFAKALANVSPNLSLKYTKKGVQGVQGPHTWFLQITKKMQKVPLRPPSGRSGRLN